MCAVQKIRYGILMRSRFPLGKPTELIRVQLYVCIPDLRCLFEEGGSGLCGTVWDCTKIFQSYETFSVLTKPIFSYPPNSMIFNCKCT